MKILQVNKFFYHKGGTETYLFSLISLLSKNGHQILGFSQKNKNNINIKGREFFIDEINLDKFYFKNIFKIGRIFWSFRARKNMIKLIKQEDIDLVHIHNIYHQISPSILPAIKKAGLPIVMTVHDFKLISPGYTLSAGKIRKKQKSFLARLIMSLEYFFHKSIKIYQKHVDLFIAPSIFVKDKLISQGFEADKIIVLPHFVEISHQPIAWEEKDYIVCFGRLDDSKGIDILIKALAKIKSSTKLKIIGNGPQASALKQLAKNLEMEKQIEFIPHCRQQELESLIAQSLFAVFPSLVHETFGLGLIESYFLGKPVIASKAGAFQENVIDGKTGLLIEPGDETSLKNALKKLILDDAGRKSMGESAKQYAQEKFTADYHLEKIMSVYDLLVKKHSDKKRHYELEKKYAQAILNAPSKEAREAITAQAYDEINALVNEYKDGGIRGHNNSTFRLITKLVAKNDRVLDYGCGGGELVKQLNDNGYNAYGFDVSNAMIETAKSQTNMDKKFMAGGLDKITDKYDLIVMDNVIEHIASDEIQEVLLKLKNILQDNGRLLIITPHRFSGPHDISGHFLKLGSKALGLHLNEFDLHQLASKVKECGYKNVSGYLFNPRLMGKMGILLKPNSLWLKKALFLEKIFNFKMLNNMLRLNRKLTKIIIALIFPTVIVAQK